ncbi:MAG TPA: hypothetical protein GXX66_01400 [Acholeplasmataceae bacterium]|jgi:hypothetical protein|nr:hypothetical protein [Acholeplasmataceae bacterium]
MNQETRVGKVNRNIFFIIVLLVLSLLTSCGCTRRKEFFNQSELKEYGLTGLEVPNNSSNYYNKSLSYRLICYMRVSTDDDVISYATDILNMLKNQEIYKVYGHKKLNDQREYEKNVYLSNDIDDYRTMTKKYSPDSVTLNNFAIFYALQDQKKEKTMFIIYLTSYTEEQTYYAAGFNFRIMVVKKSFSKYTIISE